MSKIYTKTGDKGHTSLLCGTRLSKGHERIEAYGTVDELNAWIGVLADAPENANKKSLLKEIQDRLFTIGSELASEIDPAKLKIPLVNEQDIELLEKTMDVYNETVPPLSAFVLPGGHQLISFTHVARTVCRRAERQVIRLSDSLPVNPLIIIYLNRLSDYLFVLSRKICSELNIEEVTWKPR